jgi:hypothetical protein
MGSTRLPHTKEIPMSELSRRSVLALTLVMALLSLESGTAAQTQAVARFSALAVSPPGAPAGQATLPIDIIVTRWSTTEERDLVTTTLLEQGPAKLLDVLKAMPAVGRLTTPGSTGFELRYAIGAKVDSMDRIMILTDRPVGFFEVSAGARSLDYPLTVIEITLDRNGKGKGTVAVAARIVVDRGTKEFSFEDYSVFPVLLQSVQHHRP